MVSRNLLKRGEVTPVNAYYNVPVQVKTMKFPAEYKFQDKENSKDISFWKWLWEDFIFVVFVHDRNIWHSGSATKWDTVPLTERDLDTSQGMQEPKRTTDEEIDGTRIGSTLQLPGKEPRMSHLRESSSTIAIGTVNNTNDDNEVFCQSNKEIERIYDSKNLRSAKPNLDESRRALGRLLACRDSFSDCTSTKQTELEKYTALNDLTSEYKILQTKLNDTLGLLAIKDIDIQKGLKTKTYEISVVNQKYDELVKKSLLTRSQFEGQLKEKTKVISDLKIKEGKDIDTMIEMDKQINRSTFANPKYLKKAQSDKPRLYEIPYDTSDPANRFCPDWKTTVDS
ncbi:hypothetical protein Tco_0333113 [Tanacetum coccineum]